MTQGSTSQQPLTRQIFMSEAYRYPSEHMVLAGTFLLVLLLIALSATITLCASALFVAAIVAFSYSANAAHHRALVESAEPVTPATQPHLAALVSECAARLQPGLVQVYVTGGSQLNAYTFGMNDPKVVVLFAPLFDVMDEDEIKFITGHELGHVRLGHTWLNSLVGGLAGIPSPFGAALILAFAFRGWNRACEFSADRAGLLACGRLDKAISALVKLVAGPAGASELAYRRALEHIEAEDDEPLNLLGEALSSHPMLVRRIAELRQYAATDEYRWLQYHMNQNVA